MEATGFCLCFVVYTASVTYITLLIHAVQDILDITGHLFVLVAQHTSL